ncbi:hypothetical protein PHLCEN_2v8516 [Hermanssonia centrifuga]|uniref:Uncharacterized protein n=1 Tax=Hermanssonia centrifuga TaxID=98765 RepID=A0A2R6NTF0_9APHY|nr:hypothetical protein PHLCEN_2v8516 [Hermanssonia centrifuga]
MSDKVTNPKFVQYNHWGRRIDSLETSEGWRFMKDTAIKEGYINIPYARKYGEHSRIYGFLKNMIMTGDFHVVSSSHFASVIEPQAVACKDHVSPWYDRWDR